MTAAPAEHPAAGPVDSLEVRWIVPGRLPPAMLGWFARFPAGTETRQDAYLVQPRLRGLSVKLRDGGALEVKSYLGSPGIFDLPDGCGHLESWRKWSFPHRPAGPWRRRPAGLGCRPARQLVAAGQPPGSGAGSAAGRRGGVHGGTHRGLGAR